VVGDGLDVEGEEARIFRKVVFALDFRATPRRRS